MKGVIREGDVPIFTAKESVKLAKGWILLLITPSEFMILKMYLFEAASI
jgi:hypothetical protein